MSLTLTTSFPLRLSVLPSCLHPYLPLQGCSCPYPAPASRPSTDARHDQCEDSMYIDELSKNCANTCCCHLYRNTDQSGHPYKVQTPSVSTYTEYCHELKDIDRNLDLHPHFLPPPRRKVVPASSSWGASEDGDVQPWAEVLPWRENPEGGKG